MKCPCCKQDIAESRFGFDWASGTVVAGGKSSSRLSPQCADIFQVLLEAYPALVPAERIIMRVGGYETDLNVKALTVQMCHLRKALKGVPVKIANRYGQGYRLEMAG